MLSIITPVWNHWKDLTKPFIQYLLYLPDNFELIIVDNGSTDETYSQLKSIPDGRIHPIHFDKNKGFGKASNEGLKQARGDMICFLNNDIVFSDRYWIKSLMNILITHKHSIVGQQLVMDNILTQFNRIPTSYVNGWCLASNKDTLIKIIKSDPLRDEGELFDEGFGLAYFEDVELCHTASLIGVSLRAADLGMTHLGSKTSVDQIDITPTTKKAQNYFLSKMMHHYLRSTKKKRIVFYVPDVPYGFIDSDFEGKGVGGAEASLILLARSLVKLGYHVEIYNRTKVTGEWNGVWYRNITEFRLFDYCDYFVLFRASSHILQMVNAAHKIFWSCDQYTNADGIWNATVFPYVDGVVSISPFHKSFLLQNYNVTEDKIKIIDLGVVWKDYENLPKKIRHQAIYCSVPQRGLDRLLRMLPEIKKRVPDFSLVITSDYRLWGLDTPENGSFVDQSRSFEYVKFLGKISREELVRHQLESEVMAYPSTYDECFCISAMECIAAGAVPVTVNRGSLNTTVSDSGLLLSSTSSDADYVDSLVRLLTDEKLRKNLQEKGRKRAEIYDWDIIASKWDSYFKSFEGMPKSMIKCPYCEKTPINSYVLQQHVAKKHPETLQNDKEVNPIVTVEDLPKTTVIHFKVPVDIQINGRKYTGTSPEVLHEHVDAVVETARNAYGKDVI